jgi:hypothetical protein
VQQADDEVAASDLERQLGGPQQPATSPRGVLGQLRRPFQRADGTRDRPPARCARGGGLQLVRRLVVGPEPARDAMPHAPVGLVGEDARERGVCCLAPGQTRGLPDRRAHQRMTEAQHGLVGRGLVDGHERRGHRGRDLRHGQLGPDQHACGAHHLGQGLAVVEGGDQQQRTRAGRQLRLAGRERPLQARGQR